MTILTPIEIVEAIDRIRVSIARHRWDDVPGETVTDAMIRREKFQDADTELWAASQDIQGFLAIGGKTN